MTARENELAREVLSDFMPQGHLQYHLYGSKSDYEKADTMIRDLLAAGVAVVPASRIKALEEALDNRHTLLCAAQEAVCSEQCRAFYPHGHIKSDADHSDLCKRIVSEIDGSARRARAARSNPHV